jgi:hypothetical protein
MQFGIEDETRNLRSDRGSMNVHAFRMEKGELRTIFGELWLPWACHILNNLLSLFMSRITRTTKPIFRIQQRLRRCAPLFAFRQIQDAPLQSIPSVITVRW